MDEARLWFFFLTCEVGQGSTLFSFFFSSFAGLPRRHKGGRSLVIYLSYFFSLQSIIPIFVITPLYDFFGGRGLMCIESARVSDVDRKGKSPKIYAGVAGHLGSRVPVSNRFVRGKISPSDRIISKHESSELYVYNTEHGKSRPSASLCTELLGYLARQRCHCLAVPGLFPHAKQMQPVYSWQTNPPPFPPQTRYARVKRAR